MSQRHVPDEVCVPEIDSREAWDKVQHGDGVIVDVREPEELEMVAVPGVVHIPLGALPDHVSTLPRDRDLLLLCHSGQRSAYATAYLRSAGYPRSFNVRGGIIDWVDAGLPVASGPRHGD